MGMIAASRLAGKPLVYCGYPITPASDILHNLAAQKHFGVITFQAEDEISAIGAAIGASFGGALGATGTSGPGIALKSEAMGLAVITELPVVVVDVQRGGPSTGLPTKTEQADLLQVMYGRNGECPVPVIAACSPSDCFQAAIEAFTIATRYMTPVVLLSDGYIANGAEPWLIPDVDKLPRISIQHPSANGERVPCPTNAIPISSAPGPSPERPASSTASAASKNRKSPAPSATTPPITNAWSASAPQKSPASSPPVTISS